MRAPGPRERPPAGRTRTALLAVVLLGVVVRLPFFEVALRTPLDGDSAIVGLMAREVAFDLTFWGQPYGSPLDGWVVAPFVAVLGSSPLAVRLPYLLLSLALIPLAFALASELRPAAALPAAFLLACPPGYLLLLAALPPPLYPTTLVLLGGVLLGALRFALRGDQGHLPRTGLVLWGLAAGLALWTHLMSAVTVCGALAFLFWRTAGARGRLVWAVAPLLAVGSAAWGRLLVDPRGLEVVRVAGDGGGALWRHALELLPRLHLPLLGLLGGRVPYTAGEPDKHVALPALAAVLLSLCYVVVLLVSLRRGRRQPGFLLLAAVVLLVVAVFPFPLRSGPETVRFLTPAALPLAVLAAALPASSRRAWLLVLGLATLHLWPAAALLRAWKRPDTELVPSCAPVLRLLEARGVKHAWASYNSSYCLTYASDGRVVASQPWNERFPGYPLPLRDEVRVARNVAWVLMPGADFRLPTPERFEAWLEATGGRYRRTEVHGGAVVYDAFVPPFPPHTRPLVGAGRAGDGDPDTRVVQPARGATTFGLPEARPLAAITFVGSPTPPGLPRGLHVEVTRDGRSWERVLRLRPLRQATQLVWANGQPQARDGVDFLSVPLASREVLAVRVTPAPAAGPWALTEVLLHAPGPLAPWDDWLPEGRSWAERRSAVAQTPRQRSDWYFRRLILAAETGRAGIPLW